MIGSLAACLRACARMHMPLEAGNKRKRCPLRTGVHRIADEDGQEA